MANGISNFGSNGSATHSTLTAAKLARLAERYCEVLLVGDRLASRKLIEAALTEGATAYDLLNALVWPTMELLQSLYREDRISVTQLNLATRLNRSITDQLTA